MEILIVFWALFGIATGFIAANKGRNGAVWGIAGLLGGVFALVAICAAPAISVDNVTKTAE